jgi:hypothetical protein
MFDKKNQKLIQRVYTVLAVLIVISMIILYIPSLWR